MRFYYSLLTIKTPFQQLTIKQFLIYYCFLLLKAAVAKLMISFLLPDLSVISCHPALLHPHPLSLDQQDTTDQSLTRKDEWSRSQTLPRALSNLPGWWFSTACVCCLHVCGCAARIRTVEDPFSPLSSLILCSLMWGSALCRSSWGCQEESPAASSVRLRQHCQLSFSL